MMKWDRYITGGGIAKVYNLKADKKINIYDINSSYTVSMTQAMPIGKPVFSTDQGGLDKYFGIVYAEIEIPKNPKGDFIVIDYPPLPFRLSDGSIINPIGRWKGMYCSELLKYVRE